MAESYLIAPGKKETRWFTFSGVGVVFVGLVIGMGLRSLAWSTEGLITLVDLAIVLILTVLVIVVHEAVHGVALALLGIRPRFGVLLIGGVMPAFFTTAARPDTRLSARQFVFVGALPAVLLSLVMMAFIAASPWGGWVVVPFAIHLSGCVGDFWLIRQVQRAPSGSTFEDRRDGVQVYPGGGL